MIDYYQTLGVNRNASQDDIKKAYRKMSMKYHPDRGGNEAKFKEINEAYATLSDSQKKAQYDNPQPQYSFNTGNMNDIFDQMFGMGGGPGPFGFRRGPQSMKNKNLNIRVDVTLVDVLKGKTVVGSIKLPSGRDQAIELNIPAGVMSGDTIRFRGLGDDSIPGQPRGDLIAQIVEIRHPQFQRKGKNLSMNLEISAFEAMLGKTVKINTFDGSQLEVKIPAGIQPHQTIKCAGYGVPAMNQPVRGDLLINIQVKIPKTIYGTDQKVIEDLVRKYPV